MRFEKEDSHQGGYLFGVLTDGIRPFRYRSGVHSLLGIPKDEAGNPVSSPATPPVKFRYSKPRLMLEPFSAGYSPDTIAGKAIGAEQMAETEDPQYESLEKDEIRKPVEKCNLGALKVLDEELEAPKPQKVFEKSKIDIPGVSGGRVCFTDVFHHGNGAVISSENEGYQDSNEEVMGGRQAFPGVNVVKGAATSEETRRDEKGPEEKVPDNPQMDIPLSVQRHALKRDVLPGQAGAPVDEIETESASRPGNREAPLPGVRERGDTMIRTASLQRVARRSGSGMKERLHGGSGALKTPDVSLESLPLRDASEKVSGFVAFPDRGETVNERVNQDVSDRIEQLRCNMQALAAKGPFRQTITEPETKPLKDEKTPLSAPQPLVLIRQTVTQNRMPLAFWERSHLGRFHMRSLR